MLQLQPDISLILPAYNKAGTILSTLSEITGYFEKLAVLLRDHRRRGR